MDKLLQQKSHDSAVLNQISRETLRWLHEQYTYKMAERLRLEVIKIPEFMEMHRAVAQEVKQLGIRHNDHIITHDSVYHAWDFTENSPKTTSEFPSVVLTDIDYFPYCKVVYQKQSDLDDVYADYKRLYPFIYKYFGAAYKEASHPSLTMQLIFNHTLPATVIGNVPILRAFKARAGAQPNSITNPEILQLIHDFVKKHCKLMPELDAHIFQGSFLV